MNAQRELKFRAFQFGKMLYDVWPTASDAIGRWLRHQDGSLVFVEGGGGRVPIMQFTGLKDKNGREIYEGDIVKRHNDNPAEFHRTGPVMYVGPVVYCNWAAFVVRRGLDFKIDGDKMNLYEIVGNIHEHRFDDDGRIVPRVSAAKGLAPSVSEEPNEVSPEHSDPSASEGDAQQTTP